MMSAEMTDEELVKLMNGVKGFESTKAFTLLLLKRPSLQIGIDCIAPLSLQKKIREEGEDPSYETVLHFLTVPSVFFTLESMKILWQGIVEKKIMSEDVLRMRIEDSVFSAGPDFFDRFVQALDENNFLQLPIH